MAFFSRTSTSNLWFFSLKISLISIAAFSTALILKLSVPVISQFLLSSVPVLCVSLRSCLTPPYLYVVINGIIIIIAASSRFQHKTDDDQDDDQIDPPAKPPVGVLHDLAPAPAEEDYDGVSLKNKTDQVSRLPVFGIGDLEDCDDGEISMKQKKKKQTEELLEDQAARDSNEDVVIAREWTMMSRTDSTEILSEYSLLSPEKPLVSSRFGHRRNLTVNPEGGKSLRVAKTKKQDTLESTWKKITEGRSMPLARHLKKSDTWETHVHPQQKATDQEPHSMRLKKAEMFNETTTNNPTSSSLKRCSRKIKKDPSLSQEELNRRVEAFIKKFNEEMMLQRQESLNQYSEMINRASASTDHH